MLTQEQIRDKLYKTAEQFENAYWAKDYARAKNLYETAERVALFVELPQEDRKKLFMNQLDNGDKNALPVWGAFNMDHMRKAYIECIKKNQTFDSKRPEQTYYGSK